MIELPNNIPDSVSYRTTQENNVVDYVDAACYGEHMSRLHVTEFTCFPNNRDSILDKQTYLEWISLCKEHHLIPDEVVAYRSVNKNILHIPKKNYNYHEIYTTLCCYRWSENQPNIANKAVILSKKLNFFQVLHYVLSSYVHAAGHSFTNITVVVPNNPYAASGKHGQYYLPHSIAIKRFFERDHYNKSLARTDQSQYTTNAIHGLTLSLFGDEPSTQPFELCVKNKEHLLWEEWGELYDMDREQAVNHWKSVMKNK